MKWEELTAADLRAIEIFAEEMRDMAASRKGKAIGNKDKELVEEYGEAYLFWKNIRVTANEYLITKIESLEK